MNITRTYLSLLVASVTILFSQSIMAMEQDEKAKHKVADYSTMGLTIANQSEELVSFSFAEGLNSPGELASSQRSDFIVASKNNAIHAHTPANTWVIEPDKEHDLLTLYKLEATNKEVIKQVPLSQVKDIIFIVNPHGQAGMFVRVPEKESDLFSKLVASIDPGAVLFVQQYNLCDVSMEYSELQQLINELSKQINAIMERIKIEERRKPTSRELNEGIEPDVKQQLSNIQHLAL